jgi:cytochrome c biogenesis protein
MLNASFFLRKALDPKSGKDLLTSFWGSLSSLRLTIGLLIVLAVVSIFGTVIPQNGAEQEYLQVYKFTTYKILKILGFLDLYHSKWFMFLLALLCLNLIACSLGRFRLTMRLLSLSRERLDDGEWKSLSPKRTVTLRGRPGDWASSVREAFSDAFRSPRIQQENGTRHLFAEKGKTSRFGVYFVHLGVLVILAGALIGFFYGFRGNINIAVGETADRITLRNRQQIPFPGFQLKLEKFTVAFYPTGAPREFKSIVTIREGNQTVFDESIRVNHPLSYKGLSFYQSSYGVAGVEKALLSIKEKASGKEYTVDARVGVKTEIPGGKDSFLLARFIPDVQGLGPAFQVMFFEPNRPHENFLVFQNHPALEDRQPGAYRFRIKEIIPQYYSGLQVNKDPGVPLVWAGCILMIIGFYLTFFRSHRRLWVRLSAKGGDTLVEIGGSSHRNRIGFEQEFAKMVRAFEEKLRARQKDAQESEGQA